MGAYVKGNNSKIDESINYIDKIKSFLKQNVGEKMDYRQTLDELKAVFKDE
ncbi:MAG: hypothetical protein PHE70_03420 [Tepidanaerobacteraceae bacterium]|nr:hypothetical protein [Tepidanaerobacteraceae bacterium]